MAPRRSKAEGDDRLEHPTLIVWADSAEIGGFGSLVGAFIRFGCNIEKLHGDELRFSEGVLDFFSNSLNLRAKVRAKPHWLSMRATHC